MQSIKINKLEKFVAITNIEVLQAFHLLKLVFFGFYLSACFSLYSRSGLLLAQCHHIIITLTVQHLAFFLFSREDSLGRQAVQVQVRHNLNKILSKMMLFALNFGSSAFQEQ